MTVAVINSSEEHSQYVGLVYQEYYAKLRDFFLMLLGDASEADDCVQETLRHFFFFMEDRCWETNAEFISVYLMRIAGAICSKRLAERAEQSKFDKFRNRVSQAIKERKELRQLFLTVKGYHGWSKVKQVASLRHAAVAST